MNEILQGGIVATKSDTIEHTTEYYFDIITGHNVSIQNQITDNYLENNTAVADHIAHSPITITLTGLSGEVVYKPITFSGNDFYKTRISPVVEKLGPLTAITPSVDNITQLAKNAYDYTNQSLLRYEKVLSRYIDNQSLLETRLQEVFRKFRVLRTNNTPLTVKTPYYTFEDMYIQSLTLRQGNENYITDIELTLKQLRFAAVEYTAVDESVRSKYNAIARAPLQNCGIAQGEATLLKDALNNLGLTTPGSGIRN